MTRQRVLVVIGPTAVGKSDLSLKLAAKLQGEIISADSMQVYTGMDIGTAKPAAAERNQITHHLLDVVQPDQPFNVADYVHLAEKVLARLKTKQVTPVLTGGTGLYIDALLEGFLFPDSEADPKLRKELEKQVAKDPVSLFKELEKVDPNSAAKIHPNDHRRIIRALEVFRRTGKPISELQKKQGKKDRPYQPVYVGLTRKREELYARIDLRVDQMLEEGLIAEVEGLLQRYPQQPTALQALGYKEIAWYLKNKMSLEEAVEILKRDTRRYAKRQLSWFRRNKQINWFNLSDLSQGEALERILSHWFSCTSQA